MFYRDFFFLLNIEKYVSCHSGHCGLTLGFMFVRLCVYMFMCAVRRLLLCEELDRSSCGSVLFHGYLPPPGKDMKLSDTENEVNQLKL